MTHGTDSLRLGARKVMDAHWRGDFTCPNASRYPWLWLWDSCFHAITWAELGTPWRAVTELTTVLGSIDADGFVPHVRYLDGSRAHAELWGRTQTSSITQPPMFGHAIAELRRRELDVPEELVDRAEAALWWLLRNRYRSANGLVEIVHPWESGCDHSPRWDDLMVAGTMSDDPFDAEVWHVRKGALVESIERSSAGSPLHNPNFAVGSVAFSALVAWNARELGDAIGSESLTAAAEELAVCVRQRWTPGVGTYVDDGPTALGSGRVRTAEGLLVLLVEDRTEVIDEVTRLLGDTAGIGGEFGVAGVDRREPTFRRDSYWRGPSWAHLDYLLWRGLRNAGRTQAAARLGRASGSGALLSGWAEYWDPDDARPGGASPQSWSAVVIAMRDLEALETH